MLVSFGQFVEFSDGGVPALTDTWRESSGGSATGVAVRLAQPGTGFDYVGNRRKQLSCMCHTEPLLKVIAHTSTIPAGVLHGSRHNADSGKRRDRHYDDAAGRLAPPPVFRGEPCARRICGVDGV